MKILLLGKNGQVGEMLQAALSPLGAVVAWGREDACLENPLRLAGAVAALEADIIVNAAAYTAVDKAESEPATAFLVNAEAVSALAGVARRQGAWLVHYSTDYVFDGRKSDAYTEEDQPNPLCVYGRSKLAGDRAIVASGCQYLIFRVSWVYAAGHANFPRAMLWLARERTSLNVVADQVGAPTSARLVADVTAKALATLAQDRSGVNWSGIYNVAAAGATSKADMVRFILGEAAALGCQTTLAPDEVWPVKTQMFPTPATRPLNSRLNTTKLRRTFSMDLPPWQEDMRQWVAQELAEVAA